MVIHFCQRGTGLGNTASMDNHNDRLCDLYNLKATNSSYKQLGKYTTMQW